MRTLAAIVIGLLAGPVLAQEKVIVTEQAPHYDPNAISCRKAAPPAGSRIGRGRICHTAARWKEISTQSADDLRVMQDRDAWHTHLDH